MGIFNFRQCRRIIFARQEDVIKVILTANSEVQDYLITICETMGRVSEINRLTWDDVNFEGRYVILYTRKKKGGHLKPRKVPMTSRLYDVLIRLYNDRERTKPWIFWHRYRIKKDGEWKEGPYGYRRRIMKTLCNKAGVRHFRFHALRHLGASILDHSKVDIGTIQRILGHENRTTTEIYLHSIGESEREAMDIFERVCQKSHTNSHTNREDRLMRIK